LTKKKKNILRLLERVALGLCRKPLSFLAGVETPDSITLRLLRHLRLMTLLPLFLEWNELLSLLPQTDCALRKYKTWHTLDQLHFCLKSKK